MLSILASFHNSSDSAVLVPALVDLAASYRAHVKLISVVQPQTGTRRPGPDLAENSLVDGRLLADLAVRPGSLLMPWESGWIETLEQATERVISEARDVLAAAARPLQDWAAGVETKVVTHSNEAQVIVDVATRDQVDLIAMVASSRGRLSEAIHPSVSSAVVKSGVAAVLLVQPTPSSPEAP